jgi:hypothetical protein
MVYELATFCNLVYQPLDYGTYSCKSVTWTWKMTRNYLMRQIYIGTEHVVTFIESEEVDSWYLIDMFNKLRDSVVVLWSET